jgi:quercetin dioxygenase-like cupin family protein
MNLNRRLIVGCALCAVPGLIATKASAQSGAPAATDGVKRKIVSQIDGPTPGYVTVAVEIEIAPGALVARHTHPGIESTYFITGSGTLLVDGQPAKPFKAGEAIQVPPNAIHSVQSGPEAIKAIGTYIVEKGKPLASPA